MDQIKPLTMADVIDTETHVEGLRGPLEHYVFVKLAPAEALERYTEKSIVDHEDGMAVLRLPLGEISDCPRCDHCGRPTPDLECYEDGQGSYYGCASCSPEDMARDARTQAQLDQADAERWW